MALNGWQCKKCAIASNWIGQVYPDNLFFHFLLRHMVV